MREILDDTFPEIDFTKYAAKGITTGVVREDSVINVPRPSLGLTPAEYTLLMNGLRTTVPDVCADCTDHGVRFYSLVFIFIQNFIRQRENKVQYHRDVVTVMFFYSSLSECYQQAAHR